MKTTATQHKQDMEYYRSIYSKLSKKELVDLCAWSDALHRAKNRNRKEEYQ